MASIVLGTKKSDGSLATIDPKKLLSHSIVLGQSGSGKSFFLARLLEEILLRTKARIVAIDPNGDFETFFAPKESAFWNPNDDFGKKLKQINVITNNLTIDSFDTKNKFSGAWKDIIFQHLVYGRRNRMPLREKAYGAPLKIHWKYLPPVIQDFLLAIDPIKRPKIFQGIASCYHYIEINKFKYPNGASLSELEDICLRFESKEITSSLSYLSDAMTLSSEDWHTVRMQFRMVRKHYRDLFYQHEWEALASDMRGYIRRGFVDGVEGRPPWQFLSVGLAGAPTNSSLLAAYNALHTIWVESIRAWREERKEALKEVTSSILPTSEDLGEFEAPEEKPVENGEVSTSDESDSFNNSSPDGEEEVIEYFRRRPTFIVIDEAHNFIPEETDSHLQKKVSDLVTTIAAEGRKYGIFLIISTQRPQKLRKGIVAECENIAVLKLQSIIERNHLVDNTTLERGNDDKIVSLNQGDVLMTGRWIGDTSIINFSPARTFLGGAGISPDAWLLD